MKKAGPAAASRERGARRQRERERELGGRGASRERERGTLTDRGQFFLIPHFSFELPLWFYISLPCLCLCAR